MPLFLCIQAAYYNFNGPKTIGARSFRPAYTPHAHTHTRTHTPSAIIVSYCQLFVLHGLYVVHMHAFALQNIFAPSFPACMVVLVLNFPPPPSHCLFLAYSVPSFIRTQLRLGRRLDSSCKPSKPDENVKKKQKRKRKKTREGREQLLFVVP